ncbi:MAG: NifU family protein [Bacteroidales bacterium]|nr:NifU family protein [Bacteroidales bacterium]
MHNRINDVLAKIRPYLEADGGDISLIEVTDDLVIKVKLHGACDGCPFSFQTLKAGVEQALKKEIPDIQEVVAVN